MLGVCFSQSRRRPRPASSVPLPVQPSVLLASFPGLSGYLLLGFPGPLLLQEDARAAGLAPWLSDHMDVAMHTRSSGQIGRAGL